MKLIFHLVSLSFCLAVIDSAILSKLKDNVLSFLASKNDKLQKNGMDGPRELSSGSNAKNDEGGEDYDVLKQKERNKEWSKKYNFQGEPKQTFKKRRGRKGQEGKNVKDKAMFLSAFQKGDGVDQVIPGEESPAHEDHSKIAQKYFHVDPVLNSLRRQPNRLHASTERKPVYSIQDSDILLRKSNLRRADDETSSSSSSSSRELKDFKDEFREVWMHKKFEALNKTRIRGDRVNMVAARPWGVPCGDPNQHDMPWGVCMMPAECESEFRVYRGDLFCGRTQFVCCGLQLTTYDMYQGFDVSFDDKSLSTDSDEKKDEDKSSKERRKRKKAREQRKRRKERKRRKKKIKSHIKKIIKEIKKILNKQYRNGTKQRKKRTKQLKKFVKDLKKQYRKDRQSVKDMHANDMMHIDKALMDRLKKIQSVNKHFAENSTFRDIVLKQMMSKQAARMLLEAYPELDEFLEARRGGGGPAASESEHEGDLQYDVEYGYLYY